MTGPMPSLSSPTQDFLSSADANQKWLVLLAMLLVAFITRFLYFGDPAYHADEQFYFLVADQMWHGALPFVDIWDRKPIGLFLIYAALWPLRHSDMLAVQIAGLCFAVGTGYTLWLIVRRHVSGIKACLPGLLYLLWLPTFGGANGQSPVFYNLFTAIAALLLLQAGDVDVKSRTFRRKGLGALLLVGLAMQVKYTAIVEGAFFGVYLIGLALHRGAPMSFIVRLAILGMLCAFGPTLAVMSFYAALGHLDAFVFANFISIFHRARLEAGYLKALIDYIIIMGLPLFLTAFAALVQTGLGIWARRGRVQDQIFLFGWVIAAFGGFVSVGNFYDHYTLPLLAPLLALSACFFEKTAMAAILSVILVGWPSVLTPKPRPETPSKSREAIYALADEMQPYLRHGGLFIYDGPSFLYVAARTPMPTPYVYPDHLANVVEQHALGIETGKEMDRILANRPAVIITADKPIIPLWNMTTRPKLLNALHRDYQEVNRYRNGSGYRSYILNVRRDLLASP